MGQKKIIMAFNQNVVQYFNIYQKLFNKYIDKRLIFLSMIKVNIYVNIDKNIKIFLNIIILEAGCFSRENEKFLNKKIII